MWLTVPTMCRSACTGSSTVASRCVKTPISLPPAIASSMSCTELSRATASGMNECGYSTVSRSGRMGSSSGSVTGTSGLEDAGSNPDGVRSSFIWLSCRCERCAPDGAASRREGVAPAVYRPEPRVAARSVRRIEQERRGTLARQHALALLRAFARFLAILATHREGQRAQAGFRDFLATLEAIAVAAIFEAAQRCIDLVQGLRLHLDERELDIL